MGKGQALQVIVLRTFCITENPRFIYTSRKPQVNVRPPLGAQKAVSKSFLRDGFSTEKTSMGLIASFTRHIQNATQPSGYKVGGSRRFFSLLTLT